MFPYFLENNLISENQLGIKPVNSCVNQVLAINHEIFSSFDDNYEVKRVFFDISKAFDKVRQEGIIYKLKRSGISGNSLSLLKTLPKTIGNRVIVNGQRLSWANINAGIPH